MANPIHQTLTRTTLQAANALTGNGTAADVTGVNTIVISISGAPTGAAGIFTFEESRDDGENWATLTVTRVSDGDEVTATDAAEDGEAFIADMSDGDRQVRARISTNWTTASPLVTLCTIA